MGGFLGRLLAIGAEPDDDEEARLRKFLLVVAAFAITPLAAVWGLVYWIVGEVLALLRRFNQERGQTFILVTHDSEVGDACDRIVRMRDGRVREDAPVSPPVEPAMVERRELVGAGT